MSRISKALVAAVLVVGCATGAANAQWGGVQVVFGDDPNYFLTGPTLGYCKGIAVIDTLSVVAFNISEPISGISFRMDYDFQLMMQYADIVLADSSSGYLSAGIELFWNEPVYASEPTIIHKIQVVWTCADCDLQDGNVPLTVYPHPSASGSFVEATRWPDGEIINVLGLTSIVCPETIGVEQSTWGAIKALYQ